MPLPIDPILDGPLTTPDTMSITEFPALLANPQLLQLITQAETTLGITYQSIADKIAQGMHGPNSCNIDVYNAVSKALDGYTGVQEEAFNAIVAAIQQDVLNNCNTTQSAADLLHGSCEQNMIQAVSTLNPGEYLHLTNPTLPPPDDSSWVTKWDQIQLHLTPDVYIDSFGNIVSGVWLHPDYSLSWSNINQVIDPAKLNDNIFASGFDFPAAYAPAPTENVLKFTLAHCIPTPVGNPSPIPGNGTVVPPLTPPIGTTGQSPPIPSHTIPIPSPPVVYQPPPNPVGSTDSNCCAPTVVVNVSPTPITINVPLCPPATIENKVEVLPSSNIQSASEGPAVTWEPDVKDVVEQLLETLGFPKDFVEYFGSIVKIDEQIDPGGKGPIMPFPDDPESI